MRYFLVISYCGTKYHGWQRQPKSLSIQETLEDAISIILKQKTLLVSAGRTDAGVHAINMYAHFDANISGEIESKLVSLLNSFLDHTITIKKIIKVVENAHARFDAISRTYEYKISFCKDPFKHERYFELRNKINFKKIKTASKSLLLHNDFKSFSKTRTDVKNYLCDISKVDWKIKNDQAVFTITANRFLRNMVRAIVGTLIEVGKNKISVDEFNNIIIQRDRAKAGFSVPACGLYLLNVEYSKQIFL
ncbi:MAG: tRNA pseudouridine(38-40) synthase TruA [Flavobacteriaceae bacterium]|nr:tRNA pseudouridine(38-40) synthase TruA [Flavobacteriaceae bacterium]